MATHSTDTARVVALVAGTSLVIASAGFGAVYAYKLGIQHGILLAGLTVLFAVALEILKPLAIQGAFQALAEWSPVRGLCLGLLGALAACYSLTAELALISAQRSDMAAVRASEGFQANAALDRYQRARDELAHLKPARPVAELEALIAGASNRCRVQVSNGMRETLCTKPPTLLAELGRAKRRQELEGILGSTTNTNSVTVADPGSLALATYLSALGIVVSAELIAQWLNLVPVLALELGSALAGILVGSFPAAGASQPDGRHRTIVEPRQPTSDQPLEKSRISVANPRNEIADRILNHVRTHDGSRLSERGLARALGADRNLVRRTIQTLAAEGMILANPSKRGTSIQLLN